MEDYMVKEAVEKYLNNGKGYQDEPHEDYRIREMTIRYLNGELGHRDCY